MVEEMRGRRVARIPVRGFTTEVVGVELLRNAFMGFGSGKHRRP